MTTPTYETERDLLLKWIDQAEQKPRSTLHNGYPTLHLPFKMVATTRRMLREGLISSVAVESSRHGTLEFLVRNDV